MSETFTSANDITPIFDPNSISSTTPPDYSLIPDPSYFQGNSAVLWGMVKQLLINESTGAYSNYIRTSGNQIIIGNKQFGQVVIQANETDDGTLTIQQMCFPQGGLTIGVASNLQFDSSGNLILSSLTIPNSTLKNIQYLDVSGSINTSLSLKAPLSSPNFQGSPTVPPHKRHESSEP